MSFLRFVFVLFNQVTHSQGSRAQSQTHPVQAAFPTEIKDLQTELQSTLRALQQPQQDPVNTLEDDKVLRVTF